MHVGRRKESLLFVSGLSACLPCFSVSSLAHLVSSASTSVCMYTNTHKHTL